MHLSQPVAIIATIITTLISPPPPLTKYLSKPAYQNSVHILGQVKVDKGVLVPRT